jgi:DNA polymerase-1
MAEGKRVLLIDGHALAFRAYHALPPLTSPSGEPTNATLGFANILLKAVDDLAPDYVLATFDSGKTFRHEEYADYKGTRAETPEDLIAQFARIIELTRTLGVPVYTLEGYEADDLLGTLATKAADLGLEAVIVTGDSDTLQLVGPGIKVFMPRRSLSDVQLYDEAAVIERYGLKPQQLIDYKAIAGDSSDNIPGVRGVGVKTATSLLQQYGDLAGIYAHLDEITSSRFRKALEEGRESADMSKHLVTIIRDLDVDIDLQAATWGQFDHDAALDLFRKLGFHALALRLVPPTAAPAQQMDLFAATPSSAELAPATVSGAYHVVDTDAKLASMIAEISTANSLALDTETTGTDALRAKLVGISLSCQAGTAYYVPVGHQPQGKAAPQLAVATVARALSPILADEQVVKVLHNAKYDLMMLRRYDMVVGGTIQDTMIAAWLLSPSGRGIGLKEQAFGRLGVNMTPIQELIGSGRSQVTMDRVSIARAAPYACADADMTLRLLDVLRGELEERSQWQLFTELEMPLIPVLAAMEEHGMAIDVPYLQQMAATISARVAELVEQIYALAGHPFNINSTKQLASVLFDELGLPAGRRTTTGYSTDVGVLEKLAPQYPIVQLILEHRQLEKLKGTYVDALPGMVNPDTGRIHSSFNQAGTSTGRISSSEPNLQNIPVRTELGRMVRAAFVAPPGCVLLACDYSQVELRLLAHVSGDQELTAAFLRDEDVHASTAAAVFGVPLDQVSKGQRGLAKAINFGLMYGMSDYGLAARTDLDVAQASQFIETYFARFAGVKRYLDETIARAHERGYVETIFGRRRYFPELLASSSANRAIKQAAERAAVNMPIQGSAADVIKVAMVRLDQRLREGKLASRQVLQVHDELVLEVPEDELPIVRELTVETMGHAVELTVPLKVDIAVGKNWMEME